MSFSTKQPPEQERSFHTQIMTPKEEAGRQAYEQHLAICGYGDRADWKSLEQKIKDHWIKVAAYRAKKVKNAK